MFFFLIEVVFITPINLKKKKLFLVLKLKAKQSTNKLTTSNPLRGSDFLFKVNTLTALNKLYLLNKRQNSSFFFKNSHKIFFFTK